LRSDARRFSYVLRLYSSKARQGPANRSETWGGIIISRAL
jgi:hypothetical protein